ncbi:hypothetical protein BH10ACT3_BH10ACT3_03320 [soil metagenome]
MSLIGAACSSDGNARPDLSDPNGNDSGTGGGTGQVASPGGQTPTTTTKPPIDKITVAGDSISVGLGASLREAVDEDITLKVIGEVGTGLAIPDDFNWPERLRRLAREYPPDVLVFSLSSNDAQDLVDEKGKVVVPFSDTEAWDAEYSARLAESFDAFENSDTQVLWVGHVRSKQNTVGLTNRHIQQLAAQVASTRPWVTVQDLASILGTGDTVAKSCLVADGLHLNTDCLDMAAAKLVALPPIA